MVHSAICSKCRDEFGIIGIRYQCILCDHFNLCSTCEKIVDHEHSLLKVKRPERAIKKDDLIAKFKKEIEPSNVLPPGHYVPSINQHDAKLMVEAAKESYNQGMERSKKLMEEVFYKMEMSHKNPYEAAKPLPKPVPKRVETVYEKTKYLQDIVGNEYNDAFRFCSRYPDKNSEEIVEIYFRMKN